MERSVRRSMPRMGMPFCARSLKVAAFSAALGLCAMQVVGQRMSGIPGAPGGPRGPGSSGTLEGPGRHGKHGIPMLNSYSRTPESSAAAAVQATAAKAAVRRSEGDAGGVFLEAEHGEGRSLSEEGCSGDEEGSLFVDSEITNLRNPIGGCYEEFISNSSTNGYASYALGGGGPTEGQAWIYTTSAGVWVIGIVEETDDETGEVLSLKTVCSSINNHAAELSGPTDTQLTGAWKCSYFEAGKTNNVAADFDGVECGCSGKSISVSSGSEGHSSTAIAIATLTALVALLVLVCLCFFHLKMRKAPTEDASTTNITSEKENGLGPASKEEKQDLAA